MYLGPPGIETLVLRVIIKVRGGKNDNYVFGTPWDREARALIMLNKTCIGLPRRQPAEGRSRSILY